MWKRMYKACLVFFFHKACYHLCKKKKKVCGEMSMCVLLVSTRITGQVIQTQMKMITYRA